MTQAAASYREDVEQLRRQFEEFRRTHPVRSRLPEELWVSATKLARRDGIEATAQALDVDRPSLQKWTNRFEGRAEARPREPRRQRQLRREPAAAAFVELLAGSTGAAASCLVEVESPRGAKLRLELKAIATSELAELIRAFAAS
jgi:Na+-transporting NADH:ubiquinone oxidoreductase subunit NqrF